MILGPCVVIKCPHCSELHKYRTLSSGNTFGAVLWSDGKFYADMLPEPPSVVCCESCGGVYWLKDAERIGNTMIGSASLRPDAIEENPNYEISWEFAPYVVEASEAKYYEALKAGMYRSADDEIMLRILTWQKHNNRFRDQGFWEILSWDSQNSFENENRDNMEALLKLLNPDNPDDTLLRIDLLRNLGRFEEALEVLKSLDDGFEERFTEIFRGLCENRNASLQVLN